MRRGAEKMTMLRHLRERPLLFVVGGSLAIIATVSGSLIAVASTDKAQDDPTGYLNLLARPQSIEDTLPQVIGAHMFASVARSSIRYLGEAGGAQHWAGIDQSDHLCLITLLPGPDWTAAATCTPQVQFAAHGLTLQVTGPDSATEVHLLPDGYAVGAEAIAKLNLATPNLATSDPFAKVDTPVIQVQADAMTDDHATTLSVVDLQPPS
jgi:hypothetical protein